MAKRWSIRLFTGLALLAANLGRGPSPAFAVDGVVGIGTPASCTEGTFNTVLSTVQVSGGGTITFSCGAAAHAIVFTTPKAINSAVILDGAGRITLSGGNTTSLFTVNFGVSLTLRGLTLTRASGAGAAIVNLGRLDVIDSQLTNNATTSGPGGAISSTGTAALTNTLVMSNTASLNGGGLYNGGTMTINGGQVSGNQTATTGGGLHNTGTLTITGGLISGNQAVTNGGGLYNAGALTINGGQVSGNRTTAGGGGGGGGLFNAGILAISGGQVSGNLASANGGGINNSGTLTVTQSSLTNNSAAYGGGLFGSFADTLISTSVVQANSVVFGGGGVEHLGGQLILDQVLLVDNVAGNSGGGIGLGGGLGSVFTAVTFWRNRALAEGGGILMNSGSLTLLNSTLSENRAGYGGGLYLRGYSASLQQVTITGNTSDANPAENQGAGVYRFDGALEVKNSLLSGNRRTVDRESENCYGLIVGAASGLNMASDDTCAFGAGRDNIALPLGPLQPNGGFTPTHLLPQGSPAIDAGSNSGCPATDQRGLARPVGAACDVGAVEARASDFVKRVFLPALSK